MTFGEQDTFGNDLPPLESIAKITQREGVARVKTVTGDEYVGVIEVTADWVVVNPDVETLIVRRSAIASVEWEAAR